ncbi:MAG TPA: hypothetical protein VFT22_46195 [Kofleriaceae bacterium]|nr:hypothetical protein [Kofleriaceae bacterium]
MSGDARFGAPQRTVVELQGSHVMWLLFHRALEGIGRLIRRHRKVRPHRPPPIR